MPTKRKTDDADATTYYFRFGGKELCIEDLPMSLYKEIEDATEASWKVLVTNPFLHDAGALMLAGKCAERLGVELPDPMTPRVLMGLFVLGPDVVPDMYSNGVAVPKASASETTTT